MNLTETLLNNLSAGELQRLAIEILSREHEKWSVISHGGGCEGGNRTRKGIPDLWCNDEKGNFVYIQATCDSAKGKMFDDNKKSVDKLVANTNNKGAMCISFINYDPQPEEYNDCKSYCHEYKCKYKLYNNHEISKLIDEKYPELIINLVDQYENSELSKINILIDRYQEQINYIINNTTWIKDCIKMEFSILLKELVQNAFEHGEATKISLKLFNQRIIISDNGNEFNLFKFESKSNGGGGKHALDFVYNKYKDIIKFNYQYNNAYNIYSFDLSDISKFSIVVDDKCSIKIPNINPIEFSRSKLVITIPDKCEKINIFIGNEYFMLSGLNIIIWKILNEIPEDHKLVIHISKETPEIIRSFIYDSMQNERIEIINEI